MNTRNPRRYALIPALIALVVVMGTRSTRADVRDNAGFFSEDAVRQANFDLRDIKQRYGKDLLIETHPNIPANMQSQFERLGESRFYSQWASQRATEAKIDGAAVLITKQPPHLHVVVGDRANKSGAFRTADGISLREQLIQSFKDKQYDQGLTAAVQTFRNTLTTNLGGAGTTAAPVERSSDAAASAQQSSSEPKPNPGAFEPHGRNVPNRGGGGGFSLFKLIIWGAIILIAVRVIGRLFTRRNAAQPGGGMLGGGGPGIGGFGRSRYNRRYDPRYGGGGFGTGLGGGLLGGLLGGWLGGRMMGGSGGIDSTAHGAPPPTPGTEPGVFSNEHDTGLASSGGSFSDAGGGDFSSGGGGDFSGGGDAGGGSF